MKGNKEKNRKKGGIYPMEKWMDYSVDVLIPTYHSDEKFERLIEMLQHQTIKPRKIYILNTIEDNEEDQPLPDLPDDNIEVIPIKKRDFDHGGTRRYGASLSDADILMCMTQDAVPTDEYLIEKLLEPYADEYVSATYGRQLPDKTADSIEEFTREFNYPKNSFIKSKLDVDRLGIKAYFCSNVCATYRNREYKRLGGFVKKTIFNEDMIMAGAMIEAGYKIAYCADAKVCHFHRYSYLQQLSRNFDLGVSHNQYPEIFYGKKSESEGIRLVKETWDYLIDKKEYLLIPDLIMTSGFKFIGYQLGKRYHLLPKDLVVHLSMNKSYWDI